MDKDSASYGVAASAIGRIRIAHRKKKTKITLRECGVLLGCSVDVLMNHLESQFDQSMTWLDYRHSGWHMDHVTPINSIDWDSQESILEIFNYKNISPRWTKDHTLKTISELGFNKVPEEVLKKRKDKKQIRGYLKGEIVRLCFEGYSYHMISRLLNMNNHTVTRIAREYIKESEEMFSLSKRASVS